MNQPLFRVLIKGKVFDLFIEETCCEKKDGRSGVLFRSLANGAKFFIPFNQFTIVP